MITSSFHKALCRKGNVYGKLTAMLGDFYLAAVSFSQLLANERATVNRKSRRAKKVDCNIQ